MSQQVPEIEPFSEEIVKLAQSASLKVLSSSRGWSQISKDQIIALALIVEFCVVDAEPDTTEKP